MYNEIVLDIIIKIIHLIKKKMQDKNYYLQKKKTGDIHDKNCQEENGDFP